MPDKQDLKTPARRGIDFDEPLIFERSAAGRCGIDLPADKKCESFPDELVTDLLGDEARSSTETLTLPECSEPEVCRHFTKLSRWNFSIDLTTYPLGSCTMKYNPKINEWAARLDGFAKLHPYLPEDKIQGALSIMWDLQTWLSEIGGFAHTSLQPAAGAQGEFLGIMMIKAALSDRGEQRKKILVPDSAHGTNPATAAFFGYKIIPLKTRNDGRIHVEEVSEKMDTDTAAIMVTNPNTLGIFEKDLLAISHIVHDNGGFVYGDGANLNALMGIAKPGDFGIDAMHFNLHKTFTTPHGGGGPGCGAIGVSKALEPYLPAPLVKKNDDGNYQFDYDRPKAVGRVRSFYGNFGMMVRAWTYIREMGAQGLKRASELAVLNANYVRARLKDAYDLPYGSDCLHEVVFTDKKQKTEADVTTHHIAKRLIDYGFHPPTIYFPLIVQGALMIEPTETESKYELDQLCDAFLAIAKESKESPQTVRSAPHNCALKALDEAKAARLPKLTWRP